ncbi:glutamyl-tRNA synthetase isoform A [Chlorella sorokiniana]|uniref:glutamate--tRNA ligase n=1 Tax=Chlorella sorokiniana TaxID=3076 RepID=A0A2P6TM81_CHLSO|nr:glutamyl-tRNA synthetase isoform A [Chlorella sorokiniana]|eukprot:PRW45405.1 glutamyl-tRNA synthetase isoform A [Chlorella sorokiniana]
MAAPAPVLSYPEKAGQGCPALAVLAAAKQAGVELELKPLDAKAAKDAPVALTFASGEELVGVPSILRYVARAGPPTSGLYGSDALSACQVDQWLDISQSLVPGAAFESACASVNDFLSLRTFLVGYAPTMADIACWAQLQLTLQWDRLRKGGALPHLSRWYDFLSEQPQLAAAAEAHGLRRRGAPVKHATSHDAELAKKKGGGDTGSFDLGLPNTEMGKVVTRFPPEPSGYLHIGHAKAALLNQHFASMYKGKLLVRFDDTNPSKEKDEYVENIIADMKRLGLPCDAITYTSDYFPQLKDCGERLIKAGHMYADDTPVEQMREERMVGTESRCRNRSIEENLRLWNEMFAASEEGLKNCMRIKLDMSAATISSPLLNNPGFSCFAPWPAGLKNCMRIKLDMSAANKALRDPVAFRCNLTHHWRTGHTYKCYPTYDFACPFVDAYEGVTHALRTSEYKDREAQFYMILKLQQGVWPELPHVHIWDYARLSFVYTVLSKRKLTWFVNQGIVENWTDPRMPTVQGMLRRGLQLEALKEFILSQGASKNVTYQEWDKIWAINKRVIDPVAPRHTAVESVGRVPVTLSNGPAAPEFVEQPRHAKNPAAGTKQQMRSGSLWLDQADAQALSEGEEVTLMGWGNAIMRKLHKDAAGAVTAIDAELNLGGDFKKTKLKLTWLAQSDECPQLDLVDLGYLVTKRKLEDEDNFEDWVNHHSKVVTAAVGDANMRSLKQGDVIQLERKGYYIVDAPFTSADKPIVLLNIPDGRARAAQQQQQVFGGNAIQPAQQVIAGAGQLAQQQAAQPPQPAQPAVPQQPAGAAAHGSVRQAIVDWALQQSVVQRSPRWRRALRKMAAAGPVIRTVGEVRRILGTIHQQIRDAGNSHLALADDLATVGCFRLSELDGLPDDTLVVVGPDTGRHFTVSTEWSLAVASETRRRWADPFFGQGAVGMTGTSTGIKHAAIWEGKDGLVDGKPFFSPSYDTYPVAASGGTHNVFDLTDAMHRRINDIQMKAFEELGVRYWEPTGSAALKAQLYYLSRGNMDNVVKGMVPLPGLPCPLPIALVLRDDEVHNVFHCLHETMAVHAECRFAVAGPTLAAHAAVLGTHADAAALVRIMETYGELFDPVDKALHSLPHLTREASSSLRDVAQSLADARAELPRVRAATAGGPGEPLLSAGEPVLQHACQLVIQLQNLMVGVQQMAKVDSAGAVQLEYASAAERSFQLLAGWRAEAAQRRDTLLVHMRAGGSGSSSTPAPQLPLAATAAAAAAASAAGAADAADDQAARDFDRRFQLVARSGPALGGRAKQPADVLQQLETVRRCSTEFAKQQRASTPHASTPSQQPLAASRSRRGQSAGTTAAPAGGSHLGAVAGLMHGGGGGGRGQQRQQHTRAGGAALVPLPAAHRGPAAAAAAAAAAAGQSSRKRLHDSMAEDLLGSPEQLSAAVAAVSVATVPAVPLAAAQPSRSSKRPKVAAQPASNVAVTAADADRAEVRAVAAAGAGTAGRHADEAVLRAVRTAAAADQRFRSANKEQLQAAQMDAVKAGVRAVATGSGASKRATSAAKHMKKGQCSPWLLPSALDQLRAEYESSSATTGRELATLLLKEGRLVRLLQGLGQREAQQAAAVRAALQLHQPLVPVFCAEELLADTSRGDSGKLRNWLHANLKKKAGGTAVECTSDADLVVVAKHEFASDPRPDRTAAAAAAAGAAARASGATSREVIAAEWAVGQGQMSPYLLYGAPAELRQAVDSSAAQSGYQFGGIMLTEGRPERELLLRLQQREAQQIAALQTAPQLPQPLASVFCDKELQRKGKREGRLLLWLRHYADRRGEPDKDEDTSASDGEET